MRDFNVVFTNIDLANPEAFQPWTIYYSPSATDENFLDVYVTMEDSIFRQYRIPRMVDIREEVERLINNIEPQPPAPYTLRLVGAVQGEVQVDGDLAVMETTAGEPMPLNALNEPFWRTGNVKDYPTEEVMTDFSSFFWMDDTNLTVPRLGNAIAPTGTQGVLQYMTFDPAAQSTKPYQVELSFTYDGTPVAENQPMVAVNIGFDAARATVFAKAASESGFALSAQQGVKVSSRNFNSSVVTTDIAKLETDEAIKLRLTVYPTGLCAYTNVQSGLITMVTCNQLVSPGPMSIGDGRITIAQGVTLNQVSISSL